MRGIRIGSSVYGMVEVILPKEVARGSHTKKGVESKVGFVFKGISAP